MSSFRRSHHTLSDFDTRFENRNSEDIHNALLAASYAEHLRVNERARLAVEAEEARSYRLKLQEQASQEEELVRLLEERTREEIRLREIENRARQIPKVPARVPTPPPAAAQELEPSAPLSIEPAPTVAPPVAQQQQQQQQQEATDTSTSQPSNVLQTTEAPTTQVLGVVSTPQLAENQSLNAVAPATLQAPNPTPSSSPFAQQASQAANPLGQQTSQPANASSQQHIQPLNTSATTAPASQPSIAARSHAFLLEGVTKYVQIHQSLKQLRKYVNNGCEGDKQLKTQVSDMRRTIRMAIGQIVKDTSQNKEPAAKIIKTLESALTLKIHGVDPSIFMLSKPEPCEGAVHNGDEMPMIFIFLLNIFAKYIVSQFINEAGVNPAIANPIGVIAVQVFAREEFLWRGQPLIDIIMAKMRVSCPVLFGVRGNERTEQGRANIGWIKNQGGFISEEEHGGRMTGLGAGYAAISLRDFSKSRLKSPWHPTHYWQTIASIVATPPNERASTQYLVLRALIDGYEATFLRFYGNSARAALKVALVKFPESSRASDSSVDPGSSAVGGVMVLADKLMRGGIDLRA